MVIRHDREECPYCRVDILREKPPLWKRRSISIIIVSGLLFAGGLVFELMGVWEMGSLILFGGAAILPGGPILGKGLSALRERRLDVNILMTIAAIGAFSIGYEAEGVAVLFLFYSAEFLEDYAGERAKRSVGELLELSPETTIRKTESGEEEIHPHEVDVGEIIIVRPGERIPLDGKIVQGSTSVNQSAITGESIPVSKSEEDEVFAGTLNEEGYIEVEVTKPPDSTTLSKIVELVRNAQEKKSKTQKLVNRIAKYYTPTILILAVLVVSVPVLFFSAPWENWIYRGLILLAVSCPCAFVLSTPISMISGITSGARNGILIKGGTYIEEINEEKVLALDKTRTLTTGRPEVTNVVTFSHPEEKILQIALSLESKSNHPLAEAISDYCNERGVDSLEVQEFESIPGKGVIGRLGEDEFLVSGRIFFDDRGIDYPEEKIKDLEAQGKTVTLVGDNSRALAAIILRDRMRENASEMIDELKKSGIKPIMLTGDNERVAREIADEVGIEEFYANLLPEDKVKVIQDLMKKYKHVSMVGDGVNDAPALAEAHIGIAMGAAGSDVAIETADVVLMEDNLSKINYFRELGRKTMRTVKQNIVISLAVKGIFAVLTVLGLMTLSVAVGVGDMGVSFVVIMNALSLGLVR